MNRTVSTGALTALLLLLVSASGHAEKWSQIKFDVPNQNLEANYYDADSVKVVGKTISWTEKFVLTSFGRNNYTKHLLQYPECRKNIEANGEVAYHKIAFEIKKGKFRTAAKRNYTKDDKLLCTDREMGNDLDKKWYEIIYKSPMYERHYLLVTKHKLGEP